ncbi:MAG TPA: type 4a pilus biogenesis protein PilO [Dictyoglomaceae bacterium]|nr:type 4a pilus biogenesis protein PilO [Dictyoglomaceae bacterium]HOL38786.1 type 4a pilus biogenesis protein PilO [Dictyoglomaceae bacterium]HOP94510.1 type 4a pilus biogenesis protein PilO [Dictyoglomaceae bacterium]HPP15465.1 type 4a pilus biogenesis protein PilO [Dictyoglomaceae bacterium]HPU43243.1 type 4a pilus biogenesis protein PilO [Dictyoglomaceae bacterium]
MKVNINKWVIIGSLLFISVIAFYFLLYRPLENERITLTESIESNRQILLRYQLNYKKSLEEWEKFKKSLERFSEIQQKLPTKEDLPQLLAFVEGICKDSKLTINSFKPIQTQPIQAVTSQTQQGDQKVQPEAPVYEEKSYSLDLQGSYGGFLLFLSKLKASPRLILLKDLKIDPVSEDAKELKFSFLLSTFITK